MVSPRVVVVKERAVDSLRLGFQDWAIPDGQQYFVCTDLTNADDEILDQFHVLTTGEDCGEFGIGCLKEAESRVHRAIDDLDILQPTLPANRSVARTSPSVIPGSV